MNGDNLPERMLTANRGIRDIVAYNPGWILRLEHGPADEREYAMRDTVLADRFARLPLPVQLQACVESWDLTRIVAALHSHYL
jgi:hypothetical protein